MADNPVRHVATAAARYPGWAIVNVSASSSPTLTPPAVPGLIRALDDPSVGRLSWYEDRPVDERISERPLLLLHSINAAASACEMKPLYEYYRQQRSVYAPDFPGYGFSDRSARMYTPRLMTDAIHAILAVIRRRHGALPVDAVALSLSCEFLARAAIEDPGAFRNLAFVSPTGFNRLPLRHGPPASTLGYPRMLAILNRPAVGRRLFRLLTRRGVIRYFLRRTWGSKDIDEGLLDYDYLTTRAEGAEHAPLHFLSGFLFSADSGTLYQGLRHPIWVAHGVRGDFVEYRGLRQVADRPNWTVEVLPTGALPHFEMTAQFVRRYEAWAARPGSTRM
jgi:pimeloyl-ACP methyl ester carboxylesterase